MIAAPTTPRLYTVSSVPLRREYLRQASLFDGRTYPLPNVLPGGEAVIVDADDWTHNFKKGTVIRYSYLSGLHTIYFESMAEGGFKGWEIMKAIVS
jgi:hypothetical protein